MKTFTKIAAVGLILTLGACQNADRFGTGAGPGGTAGLGAGDPSNPSSPAYFQSQIGDRVLFAVDQHTLSPQAQSTLDAQAAWFNNNPEYRATIEGHSDEQGTREYNLALSNRRANSVREYLISRGLSPARLTTVGYGKERPIQVCSDEACYSQNRRAVTVLSAGTS